MTYTIKAKEMLMDQESSHSVQNGARKPLGHPISHKVVIFVLSFFSEFVLKEYNLEQKKNKQTKKKITEKEKRK